MDPIFDTRGRTRGWMHDDVIFDLEGRPRAFVKRDGVYSFRGLHLGHFRSGFIRDTGGYAVAFLRGARGQPATPPPQVPPSAPARAQVPLRPAIGAAPAAAAVAPRWSRLDIDAFFGPAPQGTGVAASPPRPSGRETPREREVDMAGGGESDTGDKSMARRVAQTAGGTGTTGHSGTGAEDTTATPGRVSPGSTGGGGLVGGSAIGDEGLGDTEGGLAGGIGGPGGAGGGTSKSDRPA
jgi:hypothetical protein